MGARGPSTGSGRTGDHGSTGSGRTGSGRLPASPGFRLSPERREGARGPSTGSGRTGGGRPLPERARSPPRRTGAPDERGRGALRRAQGERGGRCHRAYGPSRLQPWVPAFAERRWGRGALRRAQGERGRAVLAPPLRRLPALPCHRRPGFRLSREGDGAGGSGAPLRRLRAPALGSGFRRNGRGGARLRPLPAPHLPWVPAFAAFAGGGRGALRRAQGERGGWGSHPHPYLPPSRGKG